MTMRGLAVNATLVAASAAALALLLGLSWRTEERLPNAIDPARLALALHTAGLRPDALAAAGGSPGHAAAAVSRVREEFATLDGALKAAGLALQEASNERARLAAVVRSGTATQEQRTALAAARAAEQNARAELDSAIAAVSGLAAEELPAKVAERLERVRANAAHELPVWHLAATRDDEAWLALRHALAAERIHQRLGEPVPPEVRDILLAADAHPDVAAAQVGFEANGPAVAAAWNDAVWRE